VTKAAQDHHTMTGQGRDLPPIPRSNGGQTINGLITMEDHHAVYLGLWLVGVAGFEPGTSSSRTECAG
jgi:hypothetical protein